MASSNIEIYRASHEAFNQRDFEAMTIHYTYDIAGTDHSQDLNDECPGSGGHPADEDPGTR